MFFYLSVHLLLTHKISESRGQNKTYMENNKYNKYKYLIVILKKEIVLIVFIVFLF